MHRPSLLTRRCRRGQVLLDNPLAYGPLSYDDGGMECAICLVAMPKDDDDDDDTTVRLACGHRYHKSCLRRWLCVTGQSAEGERVVVYKQSKGCPRQCFAASMLRRVNASPRQCFASHNLLDEEE